jgi:FkbH-like protein
MPLDLDWLPILEDWPAQLRAAATLPPAEALAAYTRLANTRIDFVQTGKLDRAVQKLAPKPTLRLALLGSSTLAHLVPGIRVAALRRGIILDIHEGDYGLYLHELMDETSSLHAFKPQVILLALDAHHIATTSAEQALHTMRNTWAAARKLNCSVIQQTVLPVFPALMGSNEHRFPQSPAAIVQSINAQLPAAADEAGIHLLALDAFAAIDGISAWYEESLWHRAKQEVHPRASHLYGDYVARILAALQGRTAKCLVLDLDNTLWGGVIGDDGLEGIILGQGSAIGEAHVAFQKFAHTLSQRGIILAVCSKNDEANALLPFSDHPEMFLKRGDIACFVANWQDKATNLRNIAKTLNIGIDALVFADDNPAERGLVRRELPEVSVPELGDDPSEYIRLIARAGYFESVALTEEDRERSAQYQANAARAQLQASTTDMPSYLAALNMQLLWRPFDALNLARITQLINKTNQFNLTTQRYTDADVRPLLDNPAALTLQLRLTDTYGDNGIISLLIGKVSGKDLVMDTWLMSCRVLGRQVEEATMNLVAAEAKALGVTRILGHYIPTAKNGMVRDHYAKLGFSPLAGQPTTIEGETWWQLDLAAYQPTATKIQTIHAAAVLTTP